MSKIRKMYNSAGKLGNYDSGHSTSVILRNNCNTPIHPHVGHLGVGKI